MSRLISNSSRRLKCNHVSLVQSNFSTEANYMDDPGNPRVALSKDKQTIVLYHPPKEIKFTDTMPIPRHDPSYSSFESADDIVKHKLESSGYAEKTIENSNEDHPWPLQNRELPGTAVELGKLFHTYKHRWFMSGNKKSPQQFPEGYRKVEPDRPNE